MSVIREATLISKFGEVSTVTYTSLKNLQTKFKTKGTGKPKNLFEWDNGFILMGYTTGLEKNINKHELPPPVDEKLFYGDLIVYKEEDNLSSEEYEKFYNDVFQFEDLDDTILEDELEFEQDDEYDLDDSFIAPEDEVEYDGSYEESG